MRSKGKVAPWIVMASRPAKPQPLDRPRELRVEWLVERGGEPGREGRWAFYA